MDLKARVFRVRDLDHLETPRSALRERSSRTLLDHTTPETGPLVAGEKRVHGNDPAGRKTLIAEFLDFIEKHSYAAPLIVLKSDGANRLSAPHLELLEGGTGLRRA